MRFNDLPHSDLSLDEQSRILIGEAYGQQIAGELPTEQLGVMIESPPAFNPSTLVDSLYAESEYTIGLVFAGIDEAEIDALQTQSAETNIRVTDEISTAISWRNENETEFEWDGETVPERIVVFVRGDPPKINSLHRLTSLPNGRYRESIGKLMGNRPEFENNKPSEALWQSIGTELDVTLSLQDISRYAVSTLKDSKQASIDALGSELDKLGLFVDANLLSDPLEITDRLEANVNLRNRTIHMTNRDRKRLINSIRDADTEREDQAQFIDRLRKFQRTNDDSLLSELEFSRVRAAFQTTSKTITSDDSDELDEDEAEEADQDEADGQDDDLDDVESTSRSRYERRSDDARVGAELIFDERDEDLDTIIDGADEKLTEAAEKNDDQVEFKFGDNETIQVDVHPDLYNLLNRFITEDRYGGIISGGETREDSITEFTTHETEYFMLEEDDGSIDKLRSFAETRDGFQSVVSAVDDYIEARQELVSSLPSLLHCPILRLLGDETFLEQVEDYLEAYRNAQDQIDKKYRALQDASTQGARRLLADFLLLDTVVFETDLGRELMLTPLHPLHLWKYVELAGEMANSPESLSEDDRKFLKETIEEQPHVLSNITVGGGRLIQDETYLVQSDEFGGLPLYTEADRAEPGDNSYLWSYALEKFTSAYPPSKQHLKLTIVDPIKPHQVLVAIAKAAENDQLDGATVEFTYLNQNRKSILTGATSNEEEAILNLFGPDGDPDAFNILTRECTDYGDLVGHLENNERHLTVLNDQSSFFIEEFERDMETSINPLYVPKEFDYDEFEETINIRPSTEGELFSEYQNLVNQLNNQRQQLHNAGVHELSVTEDVVQQLQERSIWVCVSTPPMNSDPFWETDLISRERRGDREYSIYSSDMGLFVRTLRRILNEYPIAPEDADIEAIAHRIADTERSGLLRLITQETIGEQYSRNSRGLLGSIMAVQWLEEAYEDPKLIFSIDDPKTRKWLNFGGSDTRADIVVVQANGENGLELDIIEVKTLSEPDSAFEVQKEDGELIVNGKAVDQLTETTETVRGLFDGEDNITTPPRREALREQLYYELTGASSDEHTSEWAERVNSVFKGEGQLRVSPRIVSVEINNGAGSESSQRCLTEDRQEVTVTRLPKKTVVRLIMNGTDGFPDEQVAVSKDDSTKEPPSLSENQDETESSLDEADSEDQASNATATESASSSEKSTQQEPQDDAFGDPADYADRVEEMKRVLHEFGIQIRGIDPDKIEVGPNLIRYKVELGPGQKQGPLESRAEDIAREMALEREPYIHRLPGTNFVAIDVPRTETEIVHVKDYLSYLPTAEETTLGELPFIAGITPAGEAYTASLEEAPHMLVGGTTGSGKTVFLYSLLTCFLERLDPNSVRMAIIDPKLTNFMFFNALPNLEHNQVITESQDAAELFEWIVEEEIPRRTQVLGASGSIDINEHNTRSDDPLQPLVVVVDEYADLIDDIAESDEFEKNVRRIAQKARSVGIHLVISTQRPSAKIIDTDLRANLDMRVAFRLPSASDSQVILDESGAEGLGGNGDMLFKEADDLMRLQGTFVDTDYLRDLIERSKE